jgi:hypothetical protein
LLRTFIARLGDLPPEVVARTLLASLHEVLADPKGAHDEGACAYVGEPPETIELDQAVVAVGATIGLGDEFLVARALHERAADLGGVKVWVSSHNPDLWRCLSETTGILPPPPFGGYAFLDSLSPEMRARTVYLYFDFLVSDPSPGPYGGPCGAGYAGRWYMGTREGQFIHASSGTQYRVRYPEGLPLCRWLESRWMASRVLLGTPVDSQADAWTPRAPGQVGSRVLLQALTAKPELTFAPDFYRDVFALVLRDVPDLSVEMIPSPTATGQAVIKGIASAVRSILPHGRVHLPEPMSVFEVYQRLREAVVLFGPDTFSAHLAAAQGVPQVTISAAQHRPWVSLGSPCLSVSAALPQREVARVSAARLVAFLRLQSHPTLCELSAGLRARLRAVDQLTKVYLHSGCSPRTEEVVERVAEIHALYAQAAKILASIAPLQPFEAFAAADFDPTVYRHPEDIARALARWYHHVGLSDVIGLTIASQPC